MLGHEHMLYVCWDMFSMVYAGTCLAWCMLGHV